MFVPLLTKIHLEDGIERKCCLFGSGDGHCGGEVTGKSGVKKGVFESCAERIASAHPPLQDSIDSDLNHLARTGVIPSRRTFPFRGVLGFGLKAGKREEMERTRRS